MLKALAFFIPLTGYPYEGTRVACPACGHEESTKVASLDRRLKHLPTYGCERCGLLYTNPIPTDEELARYYGQFYRIDYQMAGSGPKARHVRKRRAEAAMRIGRLEGLLAPGARTLDFGCGSGEFVEAMLEKGFDAHGFEPGESYGDHARQRLGQRVKIAGWQDVRYDQRFDLVSCFHVLEHLRDPVAALTQLAAWTKPGGLVFLEVPDLGSRDHNKGIGAFHFGHLTGFNRHNLVLAASRAGLRAKRVFRSTAVVFEHGEVDDAEAEARKGLALTQALYGGGRAIPSYLRYQLGKLRRGKGGKHRGPRA